MWEAADAEKSTLLKLLANYYKDYEREILIGEQELRMIERKKSKSENSHDPSECVFV